MSDENLNIVLILGTTRKVRKSELAAKYVNKILSTYTNINAIYVDPQNFNLPFDGNDDDVKDPKYSEITKNADGFLIVTPEYNHSFPGSLKRLLDSELKNYRHKPVAFIGVSSGMIGGARAIEALVGATREMGLISSFTDAHFPRIQEAFDENGEIKDPEQEKRIRKCIDELIWMTKTLKDGRKNYGD